LQREVKDLKILLDEKEKRLKAQEKVIELLETQLKGK
jgi:hypothetical protein